jgi:glucarate dehydratase
MKIVDLRVHPIAIADPPLRSSYGLHAPIALRTILELASDDHIVGISEAHGGAANAQMLEALRSRIIGSDPYRLCATLLPMVDGDGKGDRSQTHRVPGENPLDATARAYSAIEIACLDLIGKSVGTPVCDLLGGRARDQVAFSAYLFYKHAGGGGASEPRKDEYGECLTPQTVVRQARQMIESYGFKSIKLKAGVLEPDMEIETMRELHAEFGPDFPLRIDPNCAWSVDTSVRVGRTLAKAISRIRRQDWTAWLPSGVVSWTPACRRRSRATSP